MAATSKPVRKKQKEMGAKFREKIKTVHSKILPKGKIAQIKKTFKKK
jgi:hypothetical protein